MTFNPYADKLSFKLKSFSVKKSTDLFGGKAEVYYIPVFLDHGVSSSGEVVSWFSYDPEASATQDVKRGTTYTYTNPPALYGAKSPGVQLDYSVLFYDSDKKTRDIASDVDGALNDPAVVAALAAYGHAVEETAIQAATVAAAASGNVTAAAAIADNMQATGVIAAGFELRRAAVSAIVRAIGKNRDDLLATLEGTLDPSNNFQAGRSWTDHGSKLDATFITTVLEAPPAQDSSAATPPLGSRYARAIDLVKAARLRRMGGDAVVRRP